MNDFKTIIGLEIHTQLKTKSKMFCGCSNDAEGKSPNSVVCPVCLGMPGTLPVTNKEALKLTAKIGLALNCKIADVSWFDRKHYFYPDLPKGYQISQYQNPFCVGGSMQIGERKVNITRVHLEEDAGKLVHPAGSDKSYVDLNRAGTPLAEIVTEPEINSPAQAREFMKELRELLRSIEVSDADMEKGHLRCDANISVVCHSALDAESRSPMSERSASDSRMTGERMSPIVEIKNLNSFKFVEKALVVEEKRLQDDFEAWPEKQAKVTRGFNSSTGETYSLRAKEEAKDYRYFPEPDIPPIELAKMFDLGQLKDEIVRLPQERRGELVNLGIDEQTARLIANDKQLQAKIEVVKNKIELNPKFIKALINNKSARDLDPDQLVDFASLIETDISSNRIREMIEKAKESGKMPSEIELETADFSQIIDRVLEANQDAVGKYKLGKKEVVGFLIGQVMREANGKADPNEVKKILIEKLNENN